MPVRIGIVGASEAAREIVDVLISIDEVRVIAVCDRDSSQAESLARRCKAKTFANARAMLRPPTKRELARESARRKNDDTDAQNTNAQSATLPKSTIAAVGEKLRTLDAICVLTSARNRNEAISLALQSGCDVFAMSPLSFSLDGSKQLLQIAHDNRARIWTSHTIRFSPSAEHARKLLQARGANVSTLHGSWRIDNDDLINKAARDAQLLTSSTRCVDALRLMNGEIKSVFARSSIGNITLSIEFASGVVGAIVLGKNCETALHWTTQNSLLTWRNDEVVLRQNNATQHFEYSNGVVAAQRNELRAWLQSVESGRRTLAKSKPEGAIINLRVALAVVQSITTNKPVRLEI